MSEPKKPSLCVGYPDQSGSTPVPWLAPYPGGRLRVDHYAVPELVAFLNAVAEHHMKTLGRTFSGMTGEERKRLHGEKAYARHALTALAEVVRALYTSVDAGYYQKSLQLYDDAIATGGISPDEIASGLQRVIVASDLEG